MRQERKGRQHHAADRSAVGPVESELSTLAELTIGDLRVAWAKRFDGEPPPIRSPDILRRLFAWQIQATAFGGLGPATERKLHEIGKALARDGTYVPKIRRDLSPGIILTREWKGITRKVTVTDDGFQYLGKHYKSLSDIARTITGTRWSGPRFFGLEQKADRSKQKTTP